MIINYNTTIYIVPTPIGNLKDISFRCLNILNKVDFIIVESYKKSKILFKIFNIKKKIIILNKKNEIKVTNIIINKIITKKYYLALISDSGTPLINDPGYFLVKKCIYNKIKIISIPGPCAGITALVGSGLNPKRFIYEGYFPKKISKKKKILLSLINEKKTIIFYESCHRLLNTIYICCNILGKNRKIVIAKELTKIWEFYYRGKCFDILNKFKCKNLKIKGEYVFLIKGNNKKLLVINKINLFVKKTFLYLKKKYTYKDTINILYDIYNIKKNILYNFFLNH